MLAPVPPHDILLLQSPQCSIDVDGIISEVSCTGKDICMPLNAAANTSCIETELYYHINIIVLYGDQIIP